MKTIFKYFLITIIFSCSNIFTSTAQFVVKIRPANPKVFVSKPAINKHGYLWRNGHWKWAENQKKYIWVKAHWTKQNKIKTEVGLMGIGSQIIKGIIGSQVIGVKRKSSDATENTRE